MRTPPALAIDYTAIRVALVRAVEVACSLDQGRVVMAEPERAGQPRPGGAPDGEGAGRRPYVTLKITTPAARYGSDAVEIHPDGTMVVSGPRAMTVSVNCFGEDHEQAYSYLALLQAGLGGASQDALRVLGAAGVAVWKQGAIADLSQLVQTAYEGRAHMDVTFGIASNLAADLGSIETARVAGTVADQPVSLGP